MPVSVKTEFPGLILAGGASRRMGEDKALLRLAGTTLLEHAALRLTPQVREVWINRQKDMVSLPDYQSVFDQLEGRQGPLAGILAGLTRMEETGLAASHLLSIPVDTPFFPQDLAHRLQERLQGKDEIVLAASAGREHPVVGLWPVSLREDLERWLIASDNRRLFDFITRHRHRVESFAPLEHAGHVDPFFNINRPADLAWAQDQIRDLQP